jgi:hypothetical protein
MLKIKKIAHANGNQRKSVYTYIDKRDKSKTITRSKEGKILFQVVFFILLNTLKKYSNS